jgi:tetratricopeptide (TPR) repeat protein
MKDSVFRAQDRAGRALGRKHRGMGRKVPYLLACLALSVFTVGLVFASVRVNKEQRPEPDVARAIEQKIRAALYDDARALVQDHYDADDQRSGYWLRLIGESEYSTSCFERGKRYFREGIVLALQRDIIGAAGKFEEALQGFEQYNDQKLIAQTNLNLGICYRILRRTRDSLACFEKTLDISRENYFENYEAKALRGIGLLYKHSGRYEDALAYLERALSLHEFIDDKEGEALDCIILGTIEGILQGADALTYFRRALNLSREIGDSELQLKAVRLLDKWLRHVPESPAPDDGTASLVNS